MRKTLTRARKHFDHCAGTAQASSPAAVDLTRPRPQSHYPMLALRVDKKRLSVRNIPKPSAETEALVRVTLSGICNTDLEIARGYAGFKGTIGHEFVGVVEECADASLAGKRVV